MFLNSTHLFSDHINTIQAFFYQDCMKHVTMYHGFYTGCTNEWTFTSWDKGLIVAWTRDAFLTSSLKHKLKKVGFWFLSTHGQPNECYHWPFYALVSHHHIHCSHHRCHNSNPLRIISWLSSTSCYRWGWLAFNSGSTFGVSGKK